MTRSTFLLFVRPLRRIAGGLVALLVLTIVAFLMVRLLPGSTEQALLGPISGEEARQTFRERYHLDEPLPVQYGTWIGRVLHGDLGDSARTGQPILTVLLRQMRPSLELAVLSVGLAVVLALVLGTTAAFLHGRWPDRLATTVAMVGQSIPEFVTALLLVVFVARPTGWFALFGFVPIEDGVVSWLRHMALPTFSLVLVLVGLLTRMTRNAVLTTLNADFVRTARGKGLGFPTILFRHVLRPSLIPVVTTAGLMLVGVLGGVVIIEFVFSIPGLGTLLVDAIAARDYPMIQGLVLLIGIFAIVVNVLVDVAYSVLDPRVRT